MTRPARRVNKTDFVGNCRARRPVRALACDETSQLAENVSGGILRSVESNLSWPRKFTFHDRGRITAIPSPSLAMWMMVAREALACSLLG
jgi:hypothetical protein